MTATDLDNMKHSPELQMKLQPLQYGNLWSLQCKTQVLSAEPVNVAEAGQKALQALQGLYGGLSPDQQAAVKELLTGPTSLREVNGGHSFPAAWSEDFARLQAIAA